MTGLVRKDFYLSVSMFKSYVLVALVFAMLTFAGIYDSSFFVAYVSVMCIMIPVNLFAYDEQARWDKYAAALPGGRRGVVMARYLFTTLVCVGSMVFSILLHLAAGLASGAQAQERMDLLLSGLIPAAYGCLMNAVLLPLLFKFGSQKGRLYLLLALIWMSCPWYSVENSIPGTNSTPYSAAAAAASARPSVVSWSVRAKAARPFSAA